MSYRIAIHPDSVRHKNGKVQSYSGRWTELAALRGIEFRTVDAFARDFFDQPPPDQLPESSEHREVV